ncbi:hypothetical protein [Kineococcus sp. SYSU DK006]|uniref:hypothetical protein n=1 Tax=Kineococcus sp. SYSU DK006 TaxID=3383127 RepID=UPI003D7C7C9F
MATSPSDDVLLEVGRLTLATSRVDQGLSQLWSTLDRTAAGRRIRGGKGMRARIRRLAAERLTGYLLDELLQAVDTAEDLARSQHALLHQPWALTGTTGDGEDGEPDGESRGEHRWRRAPDDLSRWRPATSPPGAAGDVLPALQRLHAQTAELAEHLSDLACGVARARDLGDPPDWDGPAPRGRRLRATYSAATAGTGAPRDTVNGLLLTLPETGQRHSRVPLHEPGPAEDPGRSGDHRGALAQGAPAEEAPRTWHPSPPRRQRARSGWERLLPWASQPSGAPVSTGDLDRALVRAGWHRVMPWTTGRDGTSVSTSVERTGRAG